MGELRGSLDGVEMQAILDVLDHRVVITLMWRVVQMQ
jgi:hypothetical protein